MGYDPGFDESGGAGSYASYSPAGGGSFLGAGDSSAGELSQTSMPGGGFNFGSAAIGAGSSGLGSLLALGPKLLGEAKQRQFQKKMAAIQHAQEAAQFSNTMAGSGIAESTAEQAQQDARAGLTAEIGRRGMQHSSVNDQELSEQKYKHELGLNAIRRQRAFITGGRKAQLETQALQRKAAKSAAMYDTIAQVANAVGQAGGAAAMAGASDKNLKKDIKPHDTKRSLEVVIATPVKEWSYKADPVNPRLGPIAQDVQKNMGDDVAPDGKVIDMMSMQGTLMAAIQELAAEVALLKKTRK